MEVSNLKFVVIFSFFVCLLSISSSYTTEVNVYCRYKYKTKIFVRLDTTTTTRIHLEAVKTSRNLLSKFVHTGAINLDYFGLLLLSLVSSSSLVLC